MDILRIIKLKDIFGELENLTTEEKLFFQLHENLHENELGILYNENDLWVLHYDFKNQKFYYRHDRFYLVFKEKFGMNPHEFNDLCKNILEKYLNYKQLTPRYIYTRT